MFREDEPDESSDDAGTPETGDGEPAGDSAKKAKPEALRELAERLELQDADLYAIAVPMADGKTRTIGELKDAAAKQDELTVRELSFEEDRSRKEGELLRAQNELRELIASLPKSAVKPEVLDAIRQKHEATLKRERAQTLEVIPEWKDEAKRTEELAGIVEHLKGYGFPANYLQSIFDHRTLKYIRDNYLREQRIRKALEQVRAAKPSATSKSKPNGAAPKPSNKPRSKSTSGRARLENLLND